ncbi:MAG: ABC transporter permease subunit [Lachnospiraceae bacterium]|nr:ABC transporter permease subunit [Lachnospiraceae bacterium]
MAKSLANAKSRRNNQNNKVIAALVGPLSFWLVLFLALPLIYVVLISFMNKGTYGGIDWTFTLKNYIDLWNPSYGKVIWKSIALAFNTSLICLLISYPFSFILSWVQEKYRGFLILLIMLPFWINELIRLNGWSNILRDSGIINRFLLELGIIDSPITMMYTDGATLFGMVYAFFPFMVLPLNTSLSKLDVTLIEASYDLGASKLHTFFRVILPLTYPGIFAGTIQVFIPSLGAFYIADVMGGGNSTLLGNLIKDQFLTARNWPGGAAFSVILIIFTLIMMKLYSKVGDLDDLA